VNSEEKLIDLFQQLRKEIGDDIKVTQKKNKYYLEFTSNVKLTMRARRLICSLGVKII
jgi:hypothetical protein